MADTKVSALASATPVSTDVVYFVDNPGGTPVSKKCTFDDVKTLFESGDTNFDSGTLFVDASLNRVGIGETVPANTLHVNGGTDNVVAFLESTDVIVALRMQDPNRTWQFEAANVGLQIKDITAGVSPFYIEGGGNGEALRLDTFRNLLIGGTATPTNSQGNIVLYNGSAPTASATDGVILYSEDVSTSAELKVRDEAGNVTTLSPHNFSLIPEGPSEDMAWAYYSEKDGKAINVDMLKLARVLERISGEKLVYEQ